MRQAILVLVVLGLLGPMPWLLEAAPPASAQKLQTLRVIVFTPDAALVAARARGLFAAEGLDVDLIITPNSTVQMRGISDRTYDIAFTAFDNVLAWSGREGAEIVAVAQTEGTPSLPVYVRADIRGYEDLRGQPLAVDAVDTAFALVLRRILQEEGLELDRDYTFVPEGATQARYESMARGDTAAGILNPPWDARGEEVGLRRMGDQRTVLPDYPGSVVAVRRDWAAANADTLMRFLRGWQAGRRFVETNRNEALNLVAAELNVAPQAAASRLDQLANTLELNMAGLASVLELRTRYGYNLIMGNDLARYVEPRYVRALLGS